MRKKKKELFHSTKKTLLQFQQENGQPPRNMIQCFKPVIKEYTISTTQADYNCSVKNKEFLPRGDTTTAKYVEEGTEEEKTI